MADAGAFVVNLFGGPGRVVIDESQKDAAP
jgi:hypothetical protein